MKSVRIIWQHKSDLSLPVLQFSFILSDKLQVTRAFHLCISCFVFKLWALICLFCSATFQLLYHAVLITQCTSCDGIPEKLNTLHFIQILILFDNYCLWVLSVLYGCECWSLTLREISRLRAFENRMLRRIFGPKRDDLTGEWRKLHDEELNDLYCSPNIVRVIKSRRMRWAGHVARVGGEIGVYRISVGKPEGKRPLGTPRRRWEDNIKMDLQEVGCWVWTGSSWLRIGTRGGHLWMR